MKKLLFFSLTYIVTFLFSQLYAQSLVLSDTTMVYEGQNRPAVSMRLSPGPDIVKASLKDWMKDHHDIKLDGYGFLTNQDVLIGEQVLLPNISSKRLDIYFQIVEMGDHTQMSTFASLGYDIQISPYQYSGEYQAMTNLVLDFVEDFLPRWYSEQIAISQEQVEELKEDRSTLEETVSDNQQEIASLKQENMDMAERIEKKKVRISSTIEALENQRNELEALHERLQWMEYANDEWNMRR